MSKKKPLPQWKIQFRKESKRTLIRSIVHNDPADVKKGIFRRYLLNPLLVIGLGVGTYTTYTHNITNANANVKIIENTFYKKPKITKEKNSKEKLEDKLEDKKEEKLPNLVYTSENGRKMPLIYNQKTNSIYFSDIKVELPVQSICILLKKNSKYQIQNKQLGKELACKS